MKSSEDLKRSWETLADTDEFSDCLQDLLRFTGFWKPSQKDDPEVLHVSTSAERRVITYILKQAGVKTLKVDMSPPKREYKDTTR